MRARILDAARDRFLAEGLGGLSMRGIASKVGVSSMTLYLYYDSRHDIVRHIVAEGFRLLNEAVGSAEGKDGAARIPKMCDAYLKWANDNPKYYAAMFNVATESLGGEPDPMLAEPTGQVMKMLEAAYAEGSKADASKKAAAAWAALHGLAMLSIGGQLGQLNLAAKDVIGSLK